MTSKPPSRLLSYMITGETSDAALVASIEEALRAGIDLVQIRRKGQPGGKVESLVRRLIDSIEGVCDHLLVNDRLDVALATGALGVHLPARGLPIAEVRRVVPGGFRIGASTHRLDEAARAAQDGADFVVFGPVYPTSSKPGHPGCGIDALRQAVETVTVPVFALGGVSPEHVPELAASGVCGIAGITAFADAESRDRMLSAMRAVEKR
jgi:thiamine-phosphate diphosphorylase